MSLTEKEASLIIERVLRILSIDGKPIQETLEDQSLYPKGFTLTVNLKLSDSFWEMRISLKGPNKQVDPASCIDYVARFAATDSAEKISDACALLARNTIVSIFQRGVIGVFQDLKTK